ncbi:hypothetical protein [Streptomyces sp. NPDC059708]|uniref:hypothetical protein n=1 Tax=Streptomyces sp. NPDC059708 TaxID=3346916 RepID=UPI0036C7CECA
MTETPDLECRYLDVGGAGLAEDGSAFVSLDLVTGVLRAHGVPEEYATVAPATVAACREMRWPVAPMSAGEANELLSSLVPHARALLGNTVIDPAELGVRLVRGAGQSLDAVHRLCAGTWRTSRVGVFGEGW